MRATSPPGLGRARVARGGHARGGSPTASPRAAPGGGGVGMRVKDIEFSRLEITVRDGKGGRDRVTVLPARLVEPLRQHLTRVREQHERDLLANHGEVHLPHALARKYPRAAQTWGRQYVFPSGSLSEDPRSEQVGRHHLDEQLVQ